MYLVTEVRPSRHKVSPNSGGSACIKHVVLGLRRGHGGLLMNALWDELIHELGTVRALSAAALEARTETSRVALITLLDAETAEISAILDQILRSEASSAA